MVSSHRPSPNKRPNKRAPENEGAGSAPAPFSPGSQWVKLYQRRFLQLVDVKWAERKITLRAFRVYLLLICHMDSRNYVKQSQKDMAKILGISPQAFSLALQELEEIRCLVRVGGRDKTRKIMLSPFYVGMGSLDDQKAVEGEFHRLYDEYEKLRETASKEGLPPLRRPKGVPPHSAQDTVIRQGHTQAFTG